MRAPAGFPHHRGSSWVRRPIDRPADRHRLSDGIDGAGDREETGRELDDVAVAGRVDRGIDRGEVTTG